LLELIYFLKVLTHKTKRKKRKEKNEKKFVLPHEFELQPPDILLQRLFIDRRKKKTEGTSSAIFLIGNAVKYCELKRCADRSTEPTTKMKS